MKITTIKTKEKSELSLLGNIISIMFFIFGIIFMSFTIFAITYKEPIIIDGEVMNEIDGILMYDMDIKYKIGIILLIGVIFIFFPLATFLGKIIGTAKAKHKIKRDENFIKKINPYIYYRELPNNYDIGICTLLIDSSIENEKDIIATILNLCAKKYLKLEKENNKYKIHILKEIDDKPYLTEVDIKNRLYLNEKYVLTCLKNNSIKNIDYNKWYSLCLQDGSNNGLYYYKQFDEKTDHNIQKDIRTNKIIMWIIMIIVFTSLVTIIVKTNNLNEFKDIEHIITAIILIPLLLLPTYMLSSMIFGALMIIKGLFKTYDSSKTYYYNNKLNKKLIITEKGKLELQKLYAFENFINDFGTFASKNPEEIILWDRYLSYATMFGNTKKILNSGYNQLINNSSFVIDNIDNVHINNLTIE